MSAARGSAGTNLCQGSSGGPRWLWTARPISNVAATIASNSARRSVHRKTLWRIRSYGLGPRAPQCPGARITGIEPESPVLVASIGSILKLRLLLGTGNCSL